MNIGIDIYLVFQGGKNIMMIIIFGVISDEEKDLVNKIFSKLNVQMYHVSYGVLGNKYDVEEALSETFLKIIKNIERISALPCPQIEPYCVGILKNETINVIRKRDKIIYTDDTDYLESSCQGSDVEDEFFKLVDREKLYSCINRLSNDEKDFIHLRFNNDMKLKDIADLFDITEESAKKRSQRILKKLRKYYEGGDESVQHG